MTERDLRQLPVYLHVHCLAHVIGAFWIVGLVRILRLLQTVIPNNEDDATYIRFILTVCGAELRADINLEIRNRRRPVRTFHQHRSRSEGKKHFVLFSSIGRRRVGQRANGATCVLLRASPSPGTPSRLLASLRSPPCGYTCVPWELRQEPDTSKVDQR